MDFRQASAHFQYSVLYKCPWRWWGGGWDRRPSSGGVGTRSVQGFPLVSILLGYWSSLIDGSRDGLRDEEDEKRRLVARRCEHFAVIYWL